MAPILRLDNVAVVAGNVPVITGASCVVEPGTCLTIQGPNGAGKTTLLRVIATLLRPSSGSGEVLGAVLTTSAIDDVRPGIGLSGHTPALSGSLTLAENLSFVARVRGLDVGRVKEVLEWVGLSGAADRLAEKCSHGMRKRADLARLYLTEPDLLLLDEPQAGLDTSANPIVADLVNRTRARGGAAVLVSHDPTSLSDLADQQMILDAGTLKAL